MPLTGQGMLISRMDIAPEHEAEFNDWYDREHLAERVAIPGFIEARRYVAIDALAKYLALYATERFEVLDGPDYRRVLANQTAWSLSNISRLVNPQRAVCRLGASEGEGRGCVLGSARLRVQDAEVMRPAVQAALAGLVKIRGVLSAHCMESDAELSKPLGVTAPPPGADDWFVLVDATSVAALAEARTQLEPLLQGPVQLVAWETYQHMWDISRHELVAR